jgi:hypothetical protein
MRSVNYFSQVEDGSTSKCWAKLAVSPILILQPLHQPASELLLMIVLT